MYQVVIPIDTNEERAMHAVDEGSRVTSDELYDPDDLPTAVRVARDELEDIGIETEVVRRHGDPADEIIEYADSVDADVLVVPTRKRSPVGKAVFGSVTQDVILETNRPVTVV
ncbi:universal stress protein [Natrinema saccharevitans]|uniref:universal stress protein n=1 Tax=Natrinema saccharevitans TaxID=301967 RepID=UPI00096BDF33|nr:universal stress protein [Natrinema saccharevitans]